MGSPAADKFTLTLMNYFNYVATYLTFVYFKPYRHDIFSLMIIIINIDI